MLYLLPYILGMVVIICTGGKQKGVLAALLLFPRLKPLTHYLYLIDYCCSTASIVIISVTAVFVIYLGGTSTQYMHTSYNTMLPLQKDNSIARVVVACCVTEIDWLYLLAWLSHPLLQNHTVVVVAAHRVVVSPRRKYKEGVWPIVISRQRHVPSNWDDIGGGETIVYLRSASTWLIMSWPCM